MITVPQRTEAVNFCVIPEMTWYKTSVISISFNIFASLRKHWNAFQVEISEQIVPLDTAYFSGGFGSLTFFCNGAKSLQEVALELRKNVASSVVSNFV